MNKNELVSAVAEKAGLSKTDASSAVDAIFDVIQAELKNGGDVRLVGFGNFSVTRRKASTGRNPRTGEPMQIKASSQPKFRPGKILKDAVQQLVRASALTISAISRQAWARSSAVEHTLHTGGVTGSIPVAPTMPRRESAT
jgi:DNA-binding protein HU-beta